MDHNQLQHGNEANWLCQHCPFATSNYKRLSTHCKENHIKGSFKCAIEGCQFPVKNCYTQIRKHIRSVAHTQSRFRCSVPGCLGPKTYDSKEKRDQHRVEAHGTVQQTVVIKQESGQVSLNLPTDKPKIYPMVAAVEQQPELKSKKFYCSICGKGYNDKRNYQIHLNIHQGWRHFQCGCKSAADNSQASCPFTSAFVQMIEQHLRMKHNVPYNDVPKYIIKVPAIDKKNIKNVGITTTIV